MLFLLSLGVLSVLAGISDARAFEASEKHQCFIAAVLKYNECHNDAVAMFDVQNQHMFVGTPEEEKVAKKDIGTCLIEAYKLACITRAAQKCTDEKSVTVYDIIHHFTLVHFEHCSKEETLELSALILKGLKEKEQNSASAENALSMRNQYKIV